MRSKWRDIASPIIASVINKYEPGPERKKALLDAYPFGERKYHPYKIWLDEIAKQERRKSNPVRGGSIMRNDQHKLI